MLEQGFLDALSSAGIPSSHSLLLDGNLRRYNVAGDKKGRRNGWYRFVRVRDDFAWGVFGCNKRGISSKWSSREGHELTAYDKKLIKARQTEIKKEEELTQAQVALKANTLWSRIKPVLTHPYAIKKGVEVYGLRQLANALVVPVYVDNYIVSLQFINPEGEKRFLNGGATSGGYYCIAGENLPKVIYICEGYATGASIFAALGEPVIVAFNAYNLIPVAQAIRMKYPEMKIIIAGDNDQWTDTPMRNPGLSRAQEAADKVGAMVVYPHFDYEDKGRPTDWNDYHARWGLKGLAEALLGMGRAPEVKQELIDERSWRRALIPGKETRVGYPDFDPKSKDNAYLFLQNHELFREMVAYNTFSARLILTRAPMWESGVFVPRPLANRDYFNSTRMLERIGIRTSKDVVEDAFEALGEESQVNPPRDYLEALRWDGKKRLDLWLTYYLGAERQAADYLALVGSKWLMGAVSRIYVPGVKFDNVLILEGGQDTKKSMLFKKITTFREDPYFLEFSGDVTHKDSLGMMQGRIVVEMSELASMRRALSEDMKTFVTREIDTFRPAWGRTILERKRRFVLAATTNNDSGDGYLVDPTGNRRYWPVACGTFDIDAIIRDKDQLWAEAVQRWKAGERTWLDSAEEKELARFEQSVRQHEDSWLEPIQNYLIEKTETDVYKICKEGIGLSGEQIKKGNEDRVRECLKKLGWERAKNRPRTEDGRITIWKKAHGKAFE